MLKNIINPEFMHGSLTQFGVFAYYCSQALASEDPSIREEYLKLAGEEAIKNQQSKAHRTLYLAMIEQLMKTK